MADIDVDRPPAARRARPSRRRIGLRAAVAIVSLVGADRQRDRPGPTYQGFAASVPHGDAGAGPGRRARRTSTARRRTSCCIGSDSRDGATPAELKALSHRRRRRQREHRHDDGAAHPGRRLARPPSSRSRATPGSTSPTTARASSTPPTATATPPARPRATARSRAESAGIRLLIRTITGLTGLHIDHYMQVEPARLLPHQQRHRRRARLPAQRAERQRPTPTPSARATPASTCPRAGRPSRAPRRWPSSGSATACPTATSTASSASSTSCRPRSRRSARPATLLNPFKLHSLLTAVSSSLLTDPALNLVSLASQFADLSRRQHHLRHHAQRRRRRRSTPTASRPRSCSWTPPRSRASSTGSIGKPADPALATAAAGRAVRA